MLAACQALGQQELHGDLRDPAPMGEERGEKRDRPLRHQTWNKRVAIEVIFRRGAAVLPLLTPLGAQSSPPEISQPLAGNDL